MLPETASPFTPNADSPSNENENPSTEMSILLSQIIVDALFMVIMESAST
jgi:hypothetical protein